ncbi:hypothetical protein [Variovorax atrisoli]|uniref:hypothetical protein n=1 Tax=Variovorax atrisoli TaxID=3394203 RepID=UPI00119B95A3|nr:hypothetical protein [Variovorax paradoxus]MDR6523962.1 hypothetical protein [Variovorax paradoxus]
MKNSSRPIGAPTLRKIAEVLCVVCFCQTSCAGTLYYFSDDEFIAFEEAGQVVGSYSSVARVDGKSLQCKFFFKTTNSAKTKDGRKIFAEERNKYFRAKASGRLYRDHDDWRVQMDFPSVGCQLFPWRLFSADKDAGSVFSVKESKSALGLFVLKANSAYYDAIDGRFEVRKSRHESLLKDDLVAVIERRGDFSLIDHYDGYGVESYKLRSSGWVKSSDIGLGISRKLVAH